MSGEWFGIFVSSVTGQAHGRPPAHSSARSAPEKAATTPSAAAAFDDVHLRQARVRVGLRTIAIHSIPGTERLST